MSAYQWLVEREGAPPPPGTKICLLQAPLPMGTARAADVAAVAKLRGDEAIYEACARAAGDALPRVVQALASGCEVDDGEVPSLEVDAVDPWLSLSAYLGNVAEEFIS